MVLWVDEFRPKGLDKLDLHADITRRLRRLAESGDIPHVMFYGPSGAGKKTRISALLREIFGPGADKTKVTLRQIKAKSKTVEIATLASAHHIEINASDAGNSDAAVVQELIRDLATTQSVTAVARMAAQAQAQQAMDGTTSSSSAPARAPPAFKVIVLHEADRLSADAQHGLRRTMEQFTQSCRLILCCESACRVAAPLKSRCLLVRVPAPAREEVIALLASVARKANVALPPPVAARIADDARGNMRRAVLALECACVEGTPLSESAAPRAPDWELFARDVARLIAEEQSAGRLLLVRAKLYELLTNCIPPDAVLKTLLAALAARTRDEACKHALARWAAFYEHRLRTGAKPLFHLEAWVAKAMALLKRAQIGV